MVYATQAQALSYCGRLTVDATHSPTLSDLTTFLADRSAQIDAALKSRGLTTPLTAPPAPPEFLAELVALNAKGAAADMMQAAYLTNDTNDRGAGALYLKEFSDRLKDIRNGVGVPVGVAVAETDLAVRSNATDAPTTFTFVTSDGLSNSWTTPPGDAPFFVRRGSHW